MEKLFNRILVPVDFSTSGVNTVERAVDIARQYRCSIHLLHVISDKILAPWPDDSEIGVVPQARYHKNELEFQMDRLIGHIRRISNEEVSADFSIERGGWNARISDIVIQNDFDLVVVGQAAKNGRRNRRQVDADRIASATDVPVITIPSGRRLRKFYSVLIPVTGFLPLRKLMYGAYIASKTSANVKLLGIEDKWRKGKTSYFLEKSFDLIRDSRLFAVNSEMSKCNSVAAAVNDLSTAEATDLVILNPGMQHGNFAEQSDPLAGVSAPYPDFPVLTINPI